MRPPKLSICIPTFNRPHCLTERLEQLAGLITPELTRDVEVIVSDNGSPQDTGAIVNRFLTRIGKLRYRKSPINRGFDYNFLNCLQMAAGEYVWVFGDDDYFLENSVTSALALIEQDNFDCIIANQSIGDTYTCRQALGERMFHLDRDRVDILKALCFELSFGGLLCFVSSLIFRRPRLEAIDWCRHLNYETALIHSTVTFELFHDRPALITATPLLKVEPPEEHQTREHQLNQDPAVNFRTWSLNLCDFFSEMRLKGVLTGAEPPMFYLFKHANCSYTQHVVGSLETCIAEARQVPDISWIKLRRFLDLFGDTATLARLDRLRSFHDQFFTDIFQHYRNAPQNRELILNHIKSL